jgi:hypothetical protein
LLSVVIPLHQLHWTQICCPLIQVRTMEETKLNQTDHL